MKDTFNHLTNHSQNINSSKKDKFVDNEKNKVENEKNFELLYPVVLKMIFEN